MFLFRLRHNRILSPIAEHQKCSGNVVYSLEMVNKVHFSFAFFHAKLALEHRRHSALPSQVIVEGALVFIPVAAVGAFYRKI